MQHVILFYFGFERKLSSRLEIAISNLSVVTASGQHVMCFLWKKSKTYSPKLNKFW